MLKNLKALFYAKKRSIRDAEGGVVAVEFALTAVPFFMLVFGIFEIGQVLWASSQIDFHADRIVRLAAVDASMSDSQIQTSLETALHDLDSSALVIEISRDAGSGATPDILNVRIVYTHTPITPFVFENGLVLSHSSRYPMVGS